MEIFNNISGFYSEGIDYPIKTPINNPVFLNLDDDSNSNSHITYYNQIYGTSNINASTDNNPIQNLLDNHNIEHQEEKSNDAINSLAKEDKSTDINTNEIGMPQPRIVNIVSMVNLCKKLNLREIALQCSNSEYNPSRINAVIMRIKEPKTAALIFNSGVIIVLGARDEENSKKAAKIFAKNIKQLGYDVKFKDFKIVNIVATYDLKFPIKLTKLSLELNAKLSNNPKNNSDKKQCFYEPDTFPGLIYHMRNPQLTILVFKSGKINFVGVKKQE